MPRPPISPLFPYTTLFRSMAGVTGVLGGDASGRQSWFRRRADASPRSEEHTSELQSRGHLVCRLLLEKKKVPRAISPHSTSIRHPCSVPPLRFCHLLSLQH